MTDSEPNLSEIQWEILLFLLMCPETAQELEGMLVEEDRRGLSRLNGTVQNGVTSALHYLKSSGLVADESEPGDPAIPDAGTCTVWQLTEQGRVLAKREAKKLDEWDETFRVELVKVGLSPDLATKAIGHVADSGDNNGDPQEAARRYAATHPGNGGSRGVIG